MMARLITVGEMRISKSQNSTENYTFANNCLWSHSSVRTVEFWDFEIALRSTVAQGTMILKIYHLAQ